MAESFIPESIGRHGVTPSLADPLQSVLDLHTLAWKLDAEIKKAQTTTSTGEKVTPAYDKVASSDEKAQATAKRLVNAYLTTVESEINGNPNVAYWLAELGKSVNQFVTTEVNFRRWEIDKRSGVSEVKPNVSAVANLKSDRADAVSFAKKLLSLLPTVMDELNKAVGAGEIASDTAILKKGKDGSWVLNLPNIQGRGSGTADNSPAGKFASLSFMVFTVNEETFPVGTDSRIVLRSIFTGVDRIGKRPGDLYDAMIAANGGNTPKNAGDTVEFTLGGKKVRAIRTSLTADELPDMPEDMTDEEETE